MGAKMAVAFANIFMALIEEEIIRQSKAKPREWKRYIDEIFSVWDYTKQEIYLFIEQANNFHPTIKFTAEISEIKTTLQDTIIYKGDRFRNDSVLDSLQADWNISVHTFHLVSPTRRKTRFYERRSPSTS